MGVARPSLTGGRVASLSEICFSPTIVAPYQIAAVFTCLVTLPLASSCDTACSMLWFIHVIMSVNTHLRRRIFIAVLHNAAAQIPDKLATRPPVRDGQATPNYIIIRSACTNLYTLIKQCSLTVAKKGHSPTPILPHVALL